MRFYDREKELDILQTNWEQTLERGRMTVLIRTGMSRPLP